jgi:hypothetical protein
MRLQPRNPPGNGKRKARRYANDIRKLRAEGHTYETIRLALLDAGVSVSLSTVIREANRLPTQWELEYARAEQAASQSAPSLGAEPGSEFVPQAAQATTAPPYGSTSGSAAEPNAKANGIRPRVGWLAGLFGVLRRLRGTGSFT